MLRTTTAAMSLTLALLGAPHRLVAQESTTRGFNVGLHISGASLKVEDGDRHNAGGAGIMVGYGFNRTIQVFFAADGAEFDVDDAEVQGTWTMAHADLGVRFHFANSLRRWVPYLQAALGGRVVSVSNAEVNQQTQSENVSMSGGSFTVGGGILVYFNQTLAADVQLVWSDGEFTTIEAGNVSLSGFDLDAQSSRLNVGISWWP